MILDKFFILFVEEYSLVLIFLAHLLYSHTLFGVLGRNIKHKEKRWFIALLFFTIVTCPYWFMLHRKLTNNPNKK